MGEDTDNLQYPLELDSVSYVTAERRFFEDVTLRLEPGVILCIIGASGQGKSMLCRIAAGLTLPTSGSVRLLGRDTASCSYAETRRLRKQIGYVFQRSALVANMTVEQNVSLPLLYHSSLSRREIAGKVGEILKLMDIRDVADERPAGLPEVAIQRANLARALIMDPAILFIDEPQEDTGFGRRVQRFIKPLLKRLAEERGTGVFMVSRDPHFAYRTSDRIGFMEDGALVEEGTVEEMSLSRQSTRIGFLRELTSHITRMRADEDARKRQIDISPIEDGGLKQLTPVTRFGTQIDDEGNPVIPPSLGRIEIAKLESAPDEADEVDAREMETRAMKQFEVPDIDFESPGKEEEE